jgi:hypothetical protein
MENQVNNQIKPMDFVSELQEFAKNYLVDAKASILRNDHIYEVNKINQKQIDASIVDFINYIAYKKGINLGLYPQDVK